MKFRWFLVVALLAWGTYKGGIPGFVFAVFLLALLGAALPAPQKAVRERATGSDDTQWEEIRPARRGSAIDPTRPTPDDIQAVQANNYTKRERNHR